MLSNGALKKILNEGAKVDKPILQILAHTKVQDPQKNNWRYRLIVFDGTNVSSLVVLQSSLKDLLTFNVMSKNTIIKIKNYRLLVLRNGDNLRYIIWINKVKVLTTGTEICPVDLNKVNHEEMPTLIADLKHGSHRWFIKAQVIDIIPSDIENERNFSIILMDKSGKVRCTGSKSQCKEIYDLIEPGKSYYIFQCFLTPSIVSPNKSTGDRQIIMTSESKFIKSDKDNHEIVTCQYKFDLRKRTYEPIGLIEPEFQENSEREWTEIRFLMLVSYLLIPIFFMKIFIFLFNF